MTLEELVRVKNGSSQIENNHNNQNKSRYVHKIYNHHILYYELIINVFSFNALGECSLNSE